MALPTAGNSISLNQIHIEAGGSSATTCSLNDSDIRGLTAASGYTINSTLGTAIDFGDFFGASGSIPDWSQTMNYGQMVNQTGSGYSVTSYVNRGYRNSAGYTIEGTSGSGLTTYGSMTNQNSNYFSNATINRVRSKAASLSLGNLLLGVDATVSNNDTAFSSMSVNSNTYNRSAATYISTGGATQWSWQVSGAPTSIGDAWSPWPALSGGNSGANLGSCNITFSR